MRGCTYKEDRNIFDFSYPSMSSPYTLDLSEVNKNNDKYYTFFLLFLIFSHIVMQFFLNC